MGNMASLFESPVHPSNLVMNDMDDPVDMFPTTALHEAARTGDDESVRRLLIEGHVINPLDKQDKTPLCVAVENNQLTTARILVNNGGKVNVPLTAPHTILFAAVKYGSIEMTQLILDANAKWDARDEKGRTAMHYAATRPTNGMCSELFFRGLYVDDADDDGFTPFLYSIQEGTTYALDWLVDHGANPMAKTNRGETALDVAKRCQRDDLMSKLERWMSR
jgi:ankyrin repeat protein